MMRRLRAAMPRALTLLLLLLAAACASSSSKQQALDRALYTYAGAIRWGEFEAAWDDVDPEVRAQRPLSETDFERYKQVQVTGYHVQSSGPTPDGDYGQIVSIALINRHTQAERTVTATERWRYDEDAKRWWLTSGLPDIADSR